MFVPSSSREKHGYMDGTRTRELQFTRLTRYQLRHQCTYNSREKPDTEGKQKTEGKSAYAPSTITTVTTVKSDHGQLPEPKKEADRFSSIQKVTLTSNQNVNSPK